MGELHKTYESKVTEIKNKVNMDLHHFICEILIVRPPRHSFTIVLQYRKCKHLTVLECLTVTLWNSSCMIDTLSAESLKCASGTTKNAADSLIQGFGEFVRLKAHYHQHLQVINSLAEINDKKFQKLYW